MGRHRNDANVQCPFYKQEDKNLIYCEGVTDKTTIHLAFTGSIKKYKEHYCSRRWENCLIAKMLWSKYDERRPEMLRRICIFNEGIDCDPRTLECQSCGWNPAVSKARIAKLTDTEVEEAENVDTEQKG